MRIVAIVQARMGSTRLPGKVLKEVNGKPLLAYQIERMKKATLIDQLVIATTPYGNDKIVNLCNELDVDYFIGSESDVLARYYEAATKYNADIVVRITSDCPLIDPIIIDNIIQMYIDSSEYDYVSNTQLRTFPRGMDTEVFSMKILTEAFMNARLDYEREHVTPYFYLNPSKFNIGQYALEKEGFSHLRLTVDTPEDLELITILIKDLYARNPDFDLNMVLEKLTKEPALIKINEHIEQKKLGE
ncbi:MULTISPECIES: cytidylyltransferase domain-containing protein [Lysinibacillus]|uniref:cytidylyltransferase domain-containing protein n=1 Tax=Lysinibacillus TaxID=400634 RepID=UPI0004D98751|nr:MULTISPECIES: glycosyltransferase family protein [Lysinibacillus]AJK89321.1 acylneuraminate cytidylyltransferase [Lysinibacillus fusiformis]KHK52240.1 acylneuraminate cytidylyltransferase [Lysinibacillus sp. A1]